MNTDKDDAKWEWEELEETDSTNRVAMERILERWGRGEHTDGLVVAARRQTAGRGQHGRRWESPEGGLYMSAVLEKVPVELRERLALAVGVCVVDALESLGAGQLLIRWPNDLVVCSGDGLQKAGGVLCEAVAQGNRWAVVLGIGVNVAGVLPEGLAATSLADQGVRVPPEQVGAAILRQLAGIGGMTLASIVAHVRQRDALRGRFIRVRVDQQMLEGEAAGIDDAGRLLVAASGKVQAIERGTLHE